MIKLCVIEPADGTIAKIEVKFSIDEKYFLYIPSSSPTVLTTDRQNPHPMRSSVYCYT